MEDKEFLESAEKWDNREFGADEEHVQRSTPEQQQQLKDALKQ